MTDPIADLLIRFKNAPMASHEEVVVPHSNLKEAIDGENYETVTMYPDFAKDAEAEGNREAANLFKQIAKVEAHHRDRFQRCLDMLSNGTVFKREKPIKWKCSQCGYIHEGTEPPAKCPTCKFPKEYYEPANMDI